MKIRKFLLICTALAASASLGLASKLSINNENPKELTVYIEAEGASGEDLHWMEVVVPAHAKNYEVTVTSKDMGGKATFFIKGRTNPLTPRGKCSNLSVDKDYTIQFKNLQMGTECKSELS
jgi:hypothetical protein